MTMTAEELQDIQSQIKAIDKDAAKGVNLAHSFGVEQAQFSYWRTGKKKIPPKREALIRRVIAERWGIGTGTDEKRGVEGASDALESTKQADPVSYPSKKPPLLRIKARAYPGEPKKGGRVADLPKLTVYLDLDDKKLLRAASWVMSDSESRLLVSAFREWIENLPPDQRQRIETLAANM